MPYLIIEICDRELASVETAGTYEAAAMKANEMLRTHCDLIDRSDEYDRFIADYEAHPEKYECSDEISPIDPAQKDTNAWCNWGGHDWDAHVVEIQATEK